jgi:hypothetical protein
MEVSLCICISCSGHSGLAQSRFYGMSRNLNCTMIVLQFLYSFLQYKMESKKIYLPPGAIQPID